MMIALPCTAFSDNNMMVKKVQFNDFKIPQLPVSQLLFTEYKSDSVLNVIPLSDNENTIILKMTSDVPNGVEYYISLFDMESNEYVTANTSANSTDNMIGPIYANEFKISNLTGGHHYVMRLATSRNTSTVSGEVYTDNTGKSTLSVVDIAETYNPVSSLPPTDDLGDLGIINDNTLTDTSSVTRAQMATLARNLLPPEKIDPSFGYVDFSGNEFKDVPDDHWAIKVITALSKLHVINGVGNELYLPDQNITYQQAVKIMVCLLGYSEYAEQNGGYPQGYLKCAELLGISDKITPDQTATWKDISLLLQKSLDVPHLQISELNVRNGKAYLQNQDITYRKMLLNNKQ